MSGTTPNCQECGAPVKSIPTVIEFQSEEIFLFDPVVCESCLHKLCEGYSIQCANCGGCIPPYTSVGVLKGDGGKNEYIHMTTTCNTAGSAFYGYWGKGHLGKFVEIEACS